MGATHEEGVVNEFGQVNDASQPAASKAVANPSLTISAQALKAVTKALP